MELSALRAGSAMEYLSSDARKGTGNPIKGFPVGARGAAKRKKWPRWGHFLRLLLELLASLPPLLCELSLVSWTGPCPGPDCGWGFSFLVLFFLLIKITSHTLSSLFAGNIRQGRKKQGGTRISLSLEDARKGELRI